MARARRHDDIELDVGSNLGIAPVGGVDVVWLSPEEGRRMFDEQARSRLGISGDEFIRQWEAGEIENPDRSEVMARVLMIPFTR